MDIGKIDGYEEIIENLMIEYGIKDHQKNKVDMLLRNALRSEDTNSLDVDIRLLLEAGEYIYED